MNNIYICPNTNELLEEKENGLINNKGYFYPYIKSLNDVKIPNFTMESNKSINFLNEYNKEQSILMYQNFLNWLFETFDEDELTFRKQLLKKLDLPKNYKILITGCGLGDDVEPIINLFGLDGEIYLCDLSEVMVTEASNRTSKYENIFLSVCDAHNLPFSNNFFDGVFHFGGINLFENINLAINEMVRVTKVKGKVVFGDEGVAPWLRDTQYAKIAINNIALWAKEAPIDKLPENVEDVNLSWVLGNCFYVIDFRVSEGLPFMNLDIKHQGRRGGNMRTRYFGLLEGVSEETKNKILNDSIKKGLSVHDWLEFVCSKEFESDE